MIFWLDAQFSPLLAPWLVARFGVTVYALRDLGLRDATDRAIFDAARAASAVVITKDRDFNELVNRLGQPPQIIWVTCGNTSNIRIGRFSKQPLHRRCYCCKPVIHWLKFVRYAEEETLA
jgi:predicted nuclease of predicted toxin-antitoxin system